MLLQSRMVIIEVRLLGYRLANAADTHLLKQNVNTQLLTSHSIDPEKSFLFVNKLYIKTYIIVNENISYSIVF